MSAVLSPREILEKLVSFPTVSRDSNLPLIDWVEAYLASHGIQGVRLPDPDEPKANFYAVGGANVAGGVVLSGHSDVVPVDGQDWDSDPFEMTERDGRLYGRGCVDMKGFVALSIWAVVEAERRALPRPVQFALSFDEEIGCVGVPPLVEAMARDLPRPEAVIVGEPSMLVPVHAHKGSTGFMTTVRGHEVHSSIMDTGVSAIMEAAKLIEWANAKNAELRAAEPTVLAAAFDPPRTTLHVGTITGGTAHNITAAECRFGLDVRVVPGERAEDWQAAYRAFADEIQAGMQAVHPDTGIDMERYFNVFPLLPEPGGKAEELALHLTGANEVRTVSYGTEAGNFQQAGYSVVVCGPGDIAQAHQPNEYITVEQFDRGHQMMRDLLSYLARE